MKTSELTHSLAQRFRRPTTWAAILGFGLVWVPVRLLAGQSFARMGAWEFFVPSLFAAGQIALAAAPWQWTGDARPSAPLGRGVAQALLWNTVWVLLLLWGVHDLVKPARPLAGGRPMPLERSEGLPAAVPGPGRPPRPEAERPPRPDPERPPRPDSDRPRRPDEGERPPRPQPRADAPPAGEHSTPLLPATRPELMLLFLNLPFAMVLGWFLAEKERVERAEDVLVERERQARAQALQSQLHPHVLFNVLAGITELVHEDPDAAEEALVGLTELLRMLMRHGSALSLPLGQERALLRRYLGIEAIRLGARLAVQWNWEEDLDRILVPPLLLQPLVENAVKHGIAPSPEGGILRLEASKTATGLLLRVVNSGQPLNQEARDGTGLGNLRERLALLPEPRPVLELRQEEGWTVAELHIVGNLVT